jgi:hypothetical protein
MFTTTSARRWVVVALSALTAALAFVPSASAVRSLFFEETASAFWAVPHTCDDGSIVEGTLLVQSTRDFESPERGGPRPHGQATVPGRLPWRHLVQLGRGGRPGNHHEHREPQERHR